nr:hypothetical protein CFP56_39250 [Quercus suber]
MARRTPQSQFDIAHLLLDHTSIEHENENQGECIDRWCVERRLRRGDWYRRSWNSEEGALVTKGANPNLAGEDDASVRVENRGTGFAAKRSVGRSG